MLEGLPPERSRAAALVLVACLQAAIMPVAAAASDYAGLTLDAALRKLSGLGLNIVYSDALVRPDMRIGQEPRSDAPRAILDELVAPHGLRVVDGPGGALLLTPDETSGTGPSSSQVPPALPVELAGVVVSASHYRLEIGGTGANRVMTAGDIDLLPEIGGDPLRAVARLPGVARQDFNSKPRLRGGAGDETLVRFDDLRLYNPYHLKDFQDLFSSVNPSVISQLNVYAAGFPVSYGDRMSGVIDIAPIKPDRSLQGRVDASFFNVGALLAGQQQDGATNWIVSARRGLLDLVFDVAAPALGQPRYADLYGHLGHRFSKNLALSVNILVSEDDLTVFDSDQEEEASADYRDEYYWLRLDLGRADEAGGRILASHTRLSSERAGTAALPGVGSGFLFDVRSFSIDSIQGDFWWPVSGDGQLQAGMEWRSARGRYRYQDAASFDLLFLIPGAPTTPTRARQLSVTPSGDQYAAYVNWRVTPVDAVIADLGLRWDRETLGDENDSQLSPRLSVLWEIDERTRLRAGWGRFFQAQGIDELRVNDGDPRFLPAQRADHAVVGLERTLGHGLDLRLEAYRKSYGNLQPRYENLFDTLVVLPELKPDRALIGPARAKAEGVEVTLGFQGYTGLEGWLSYSWSTVVDRLEGQTVRRSWDQAHYASVGLSQRGAIWEWSVAGTWHTGWPTTEIALVAAEPIPLVAAGPRNARKLGAYARLDARVARHFALRGDSDLIAYLEISNLTHRRNDCCVEYQIEPEDGIPVLDVARRPSLPLLPNLGFSWRF